MTSSDQPIFHVRFDIDTITCTQVGLPLLMDYADRKGIHFSFFANMGRAVSHSALFRRKLDRAESRDATEKAAHLSPIKKLGLRSYLVTALYNPYVGAGVPTLLRDLKAQGHDLGLHGGQNHGAWQHGAMDWSSDRLNREIQWGMDEMEKAGLPAPDMFASPGFVSPPGLAVALEAKGFWLLADRHEYSKPIEPKVEEGCNKLVQINTGLAGEPGGVGYFENLYARGVQPDDIGKLLCPFLNQGHFVCYDHPAFIGGIGWDLFRAALDFWLNSGGLVGPLSASPVLQRKLI